LVRASKKIGLLNHMGGGNLGDDATQTVVMENIKKRWPESVLFGFSMNPPDTQARHGIPSFPIRRQTWDRTPRPENQAEVLKQRVKTVVIKYRTLFKLLKAINTTLMRVPREVAQELLFLFKSLRIIRSFDLLIISGGGQLLDSWGGPWKFPYTIFKWVVLAKLSNVKCYFLDVGAGPLRHPLGKFFIRRALSLGDYASFRDEKSRELVQEIGFTGRAQVLPDCVYGLNGTALKGGFSGGQSEPVVGISPMAYCDPRVYWEKDQGVYENFIRTLALFGSWLIRNHHRLRLLSTDIWFDARTIEELKIALSSEVRPGIPDSILHDPISTTEELLSQLHSLDYIITCRYHGVVFAHLMNVPVLALSHHLKVATLMNDLGLSEYCLDIRTFDLGLLKNTFLRLAGNRDHVKARMARTAADYKRRLTVQFDALFPQTMRR
jgi:polysaccharide pyruvyl transferase WcaK-like protein